MNPDRIEGVRAITEALAELFGGLPFSRDQVYRLSTRRTHALPVDGFKGRVWASRAALALWVAAERRRAGRTAPADEVQRPMGRAPIVGEAAIAIVLRALLGRDVGLREPSQLAARDRDPLPARLNDGALAVGRQELLQWSQRERARGAIEALAQVPDGTIAADLAKAIGAGLAFMERARQDRAAPTKGRGRLSGPVRLTTRGRR